MQHRAMNGVHSAGDVSDGNALRTHLSCSLRGASAWLASKRRFTVSARGVRLRLVLANKNQHSRSPPTHGFRVGASEASAVALPVDASNGKRSAPGWFGAAARSYKRAS